MRKRGVNLRSLTAFIVTWALAVAVVTYTPEGRFSGTGVGRETLAQLCAEIGIPADRARASLDRAGIAWSDEKLKAIAESAGLEPIDVLTAMLVPGHELPGRSS